MDPKRIVPDLNASQWNIVQVGYTRVWFALDMRFHGVRLVFVHVGYPLRTWFLVEYGLHNTIYCISTVVNNKEIAIDFGSEKTGIPLPE